MASKYFISDIMYKSKYSHQVVIVDLQNTSINYPCQLFALTEIKRVMSDV